MLANEILFFSTNIILENEVQCDDMQSLRTIYTVLPS